MIAISSPPRNKPLDKVLQQVERVGLATAVNFTVVVARVVAMVTQKTMKLKKESL